MHPVTPITFKIGHLGHYNKVRHLYLTTENIPKAILLYYTVSQNLCRKLARLFWNLYDELLYHFLSTPSIRITDWLQKISYNYFPDKTLESEWK